MAELLEAIWDGRASGPARVLAAALAPAEAAFGVASAFFHAAHERGWTRVETAPVPVVSVGNLTVGGAGKTPVTRWVVERLAEIGARPAVLHGGYADDEPELHRHWNPAIPVVAMRDRAEGARRAAALGAGVVVLDDGFQHRRLARDLDLVLVAAESWTDRPHLLPRGRWRERPLALSRAGAVVVTRKTASREDGARVMAALRAHAPGALLGQIHLAPAGWRTPAGGRVESLGGRAALAVAAIAGPERFLANARAAGAEVRDAMVFRDHHEYDGEDAERIRARAGGRPVVTTEKDWIKLRRLGLEGELWVLEQAVEFEHGRAELEARLREVARR